MKKFIQFIMCTILCTQAASALEAWFFSRDSNVISKNGGSVKTACPALCADGWQRMGGSNGNWIPGDPAGTRYDMVAYEGGCADNGFHDPAAYLWCRCTAWEAIITDSHCGAGATRKKTPQPKNHKIGK